MTTCEQVQAQLLGYLYDLLDDGDKAAADAHLAGCERCQLALAAARRQQRLLAAAAKTAFPNVQFTRPTTVPEIAAYPTPPRKIRSSRFHFALAASIFVAAGLAIPTTWFGWKAHELKARLRQEETALAEARSLQGALTQEKEAEARRLQTALKESEKTVAQLQVEQQAKWTALNKSIADRQLQLSVTGPEVLQPGTESDYIIQTRNLQNEALTAQLSARVVDQDGKVFFELKDKPTLGSYHLHLPADLPMTPEKKLSLDVLARRDGQPDRQLHQKIALAAPVYLTHLATDKPMYRPGETVHYRSLTLERFSLKPVQEQLNLQFTITGPQGDEIFKQAGASRLRGTNGALVAMPDGKPVAGIGAGEFLLPATITGGEFTLTVREANNRFPEQERKFIVNNFANPRLNKELDFTRKSYGPGQEVVAACSATFVEGGPVANRPVIASIFIDGKPYGPDGKEGATPLHLQTDALGKVNVRFKLPAVIERGQGSLSVQFNDGGSVEPLVRTIPITLKKLLVDFFPEGGDLIAGAPNRVYFQARTTLGKPAELKGHLVDDRGATLATAVATLHDDLKPGVNQGMGRFAFTPTMGRRYELKIDEPAGMKGIYALPAVHDEGVILQVAQPDKEHLRVQVTSVDKDRDLLLGVYCRGRLLDHQILQAKKNEMATVDMKPKLPTGGVFRITVFEEMPPGTATRLAPRAERLVYRDPANPLTLTAKLNQERYVPGDRVKLSLSTFDNKEAVVPAIAMAAVVDKSVLTLADEKTFRGMPTHYYLSTEIRRPEELEYADFLVSSSPKAPEALDLLLGTQGWRRFAEQNPEQFRKKHKEDADRLLLTMGQPTPVEVDFARQEVQQMRDEYVARVETVEMGRKQLQKSLADIQNPNGPLPTKIQSAVQSVAAANSRLQEEKQALLQHWQLVEALREYAFPVSGITCLVLLMGSLLLGLAKGRRRGRVYYLVTGLGIAGTVYLFANLEQLQNVRSRDGGIESGDHYRQFGVEARNEREEGLVAKEAARAEPAGPAIQLKGYQERQKGLIGNGGPGQQAGGFGGGKAAGGFGGGGFGGGDRRNGGFGDQAMPVPDAPAGAINFLGRAQNGGVPAGIGGGMGAGIGGIAGGIGGVRNLRAMPAPAPLALPAANADSLLHSKAELQKNQPTVDFYKQDEKKEGKLAGAKPNTQNPVSAARGITQLNASNPSAPAPVAKDESKKSPVTRLPELGYIIISGDNPKDVAGMEKIINARMAGPGAPLGAGKPAGLELKQLEKERIGAGGGGRGVGAGGGFAGKGMLPEAKAADEKLKAPKQQLRELWEPALGLEGQRGFAFNVPPPAPIPEPMLVREYAHVRPPDMSPGERKDFVDTVYWHPALVLPNGKVDVDFQLCDSVTTYQLLVFGHTEDGRIGSLTKTIEARLPFTLEPKLPLEVTAGDRIDMPVSVANNTSESRSVRMQLETTNMKLLDQNGQASSSGEPIELHADARGRKIYSLRPAVVEGDAQIILDGFSEPFRDRVIRRVPVVPRGFPVAQAHSDLLEQTARQDLVLPDAWILGTLECRVSVYPSTLASLQKGLEGLLREPNGCFEQTSTTNYPNLLILDYLRESNQAKPELEKRVRELLANGYAKLMSFECYENGPTKRRGFEWFGGPAAPHEALTAYGLLQFRDMARVYDVDKTMLERTRQYLVSRKDGQGGFQRNARALDHFGHAPADVTNAYIVWSLTESGKDDDVTQELATLADQARTVKDPYFLALVALGLINRDRTPEGITILKGLVAAQKEDGHLDAQRTSITGSGGRDLQIETTALAVLGWLKANRPADFNAATQKAIRWIGQQRGGSGAFGSTQSTILALKALIGFTRANKRTAEAGALTLSVAGKTEARLEFPAGAQDVMTLDLPEASKHLHAGHNDVQVAITGQNQFPYTLAWNYQVESPPVAAGCVVQVKTQLDRTSVEEGEAVHLNVTLENVEDHGQSMTVAIIGLPAGLTLPEDMKQLKDHCRLREDGAKPGLISAWEIRGRELILYWRDLAPRQKIEVPIDLIARVPGDYTGPASRTYLYYNADRKNWIKPLRVQIAVKGGSQR